MTFPFEVDWAVGKRFSADRKTRDYKVHVLFALSLTGGFNGTFHPPDQYDRLGGWEAVAIRKGVFRACASQRV